MGGLKKNMPVTHATMFIATLAISGIPGFAGFFSKDEISGRLIRIRMRGSAWCTPSGSSPRA